MTYQILSIIIQACAIVGTDTYGHRVMQLQRECQAKIVTCFQEKRKDLKVYYEDALESCLKDVK